jgi:hypothetical protein
MTVPKDEKDLTELEKELHSSEEQENHIHSEIEHAHHGHIEYETSEDMEILLLNAVAHTIGHIQMNTGEIAKDLKALTKKIDELKDAVLMLVKGQLLNFIDDADVRKKLLLELLKDLSKTK